MDKAMMKRGKTAIMNSGLHGLHHETVNHSVNFVDPAASVHTQHAESNWSAAKEKF